MMTRADGVSGRDTPLSGGSATRYPRGTLAEAGRGDAGRRRKPGNVLIAAYVPEAEPEWHESSVLRGLKRLHVTF
jgi:hypothetical protein